MGCLRFQLLRRFFRYAFHVAACCSALALVACLILWPRSYYRWEALFTSTTRHSVSVFSDLGRLEAYWRAGKLHPGIHVASHPIDPAKITPADRWCYLYWDSTVEDLEGVVQREYQFLGLYLRLFDLAPPTNVFLAIPYSYLTALSALLPALWLRRFFRRRRAARLARPGFPIEPPSPSETRPSGSGSADSPPPAR